MPSQPGSGPLPHIRGNTPVTLTPHRHQHNPQPLSLFNHLHPITLVEVVRRLTLSVVRHL